MSDAMLSAKGFDAWGVGPSAAAARAAGFGYRTWYSSYDPSKDAPSKAAIEAYAAAGIWSVTNFETTIDRIFAGYDAGRADMRHAIDEYVPKGMPPGASILLSADMSIDPSQFNRVLPYYQGSFDEAAGKYLNALYGEQALIAFLKQRGVCQVGWRSMSTSFPGGSSTAFCDLVQTTGGTIAGSSIDLSYATGGPSAFFGQWMPGRLFSVSAPPAPPPVLVKEDDDMQQIESLAVKADGQYAYSFAAGSKSAIVFGYDGFGKQATLRVAVWDARGVTVTQLPVGNPTGGQGHSTACQFPDKGTAYMVTIVRTDGNAGPVGVSLQ